MLEGLCAARSNELGALLLIENTSVQSETFWHNLIYTSVKNILRLIVIIQYYVSSVFILPHLLKFSLKIIKLFRVPPYFLFDLNPTKE